MESKYDSRRGTGHKEGLWRPKISLRFIVQLDIFRGKTWGLAILLFLRGSLGLPGSVLVVLFLTGRSLFCSPWRLGSWLCASFIGSSCLLLSWLLFALAATSPVAVSAAPCHLASMSKSSCPRAASEPEQLAQTRCTLASFNEEANYWINEDLITELIRVFFCESKLTLCRFLLGKNILDSGNIYTTHNEQPHWKVLRRWWLKLSFCISLFIPIFCILPVSLRECLYRETDQMDKMYNMTVT